MLNISIINICDACQGESDADTEIRANSYMIKFEALVRAFRESLADPSLPVIQVNREIPFPRDKS